MLAPESTAEFLEKWEFLRLSGSSTFERRLSDWLTAMDSQLPMISPGLPPDSPSPLCLRRTCRLLGLNQAEMVQRTVIAPQRYAELESGLSLTPTELLTLMEVLRAAGLVGLTAVDLAGAVRDPGTVATRRSTK